MKNELNPVTAGGIVAVVAIVVVVLGYMIFFKKPAYTPPANAPTSGGAKSLINTDPGASGK